MRTNIFEFFPAYRNKLSFAIISIAIFTFVIDTSISKVYYFEINQPLFGQKAGIFVAISIVFVLTQYVVHSFARKDNDKRDNLYLKILGKGVTVVQYALVGILLFVTFELFFTSGYVPDILTAATAISYTIGIIVMAFLAARFFSWFKSNRDLVILLYGLSSAVIALNLIFGIISVDLAMQNQPPIIRERMGFVTPFFNPNPFIAHINYTYLLSSIISFMLTWAATAFLLRHHVRKINALAYWILITLPLLFFLVQFQPLFLTVFDEFSRTNSVFFGVISTLVFSWSKPIGGILFGIAFLVMALKIKHNDKLRKYAIIAAYGYMLFFVSNQAIVLISAPYPPFGLATISFVGLSTYLVMVGIYSSATSISEDISLRKSIRKSILDNANLLDSIGVAEEQALYRKIVTIAKEQAEKTNTETLLNENEIRQYMDEVLEELKHKKTKDAQS